MRTDDVRFLLGYDEWATRRLFRVTSGLDPAEWSRTHVIDQRGLGGILVHELGALRRWRHRLTAQPGDPPRPELEPLPTPGVLLEAFDAEWRRYGEWLGGLADDALGLEWSEAPLWQWLAHVFNHGTQHRSEAAVLLTAMGRSPGDLDLLDYVEQRASAPA